VDVEAEATEEESAETTVVVAEEVEIEMVRVNIDKMIVITKIRDTKLKSMGMTESENTMIMTIRMADTVAVEENTMIRGVVATSVVEVIEAVDNVEIVEEANTMVTVKRRSPIIRKMERAVK